MKRSLVPLFVASLAASAGAQTIIAGPLVGSNGQRYYLVDAANFAAAEAKAQAMGGHIASIDGPQENDLVLGLANYGGTPRKVFVGLTDRGVEGTWTWTSGEPVGYTNWAPGQPANHQNSDHVYMYPNDVWTGQWACVNDTYTRYSVIEVEGACHVPREFATIAEAALFAMPGAEIVVAPGVYESGELVRLVVPRLRLRSTGGAAATIVRDPIFVASGEVPMVIDGFTFDTGDELAIEATGSVRLEVRNSRIRSSPYSVRVEYGANVALVNCIVHAVGLGAIELHPYSSDLALSLLNTTLVGPAGYAIIGNEDGFGTPTVSIMNSIVRTGVEPFLDVTPDRVLHSNIALDVDDWSGNFSADPVFVDGDGADNIAGTLDDDYRLRAGSPCIDSGDSDPADLYVNDLAAAFELVDFDGAVRAIDDPATANTFRGRAAIDVGAFEYQPERCPGDFNGDGALNIFDFLGFQAAFGNGC